MVNSIMNFKLKTMRTLYDKVYEVEDNFQHVGGDWRLKRRFVDLYENFYAKNGRQLEFYVQVARTISHE